MKQSIFLFAAAILIFLQSSCSYKTRDILFKTSENVNGKDISPVYIANKQTVQEESNMIAVDDILNIINLQNPDLISGIPSSNVMGSQGNSQGYKVDIDGTVSVPVLGKVSLLGLTVLQAEEKLTTMYKKEFLKAPIIDISIQNMTVTLLGEVNRPGNYPIKKERLSLVELLGEAGGLTNRSNKGTIKIIRGNKANPEILYVDLRDIKALSYEELYVRKNDIIYVEPNGAARAGDRLSKVSTVVQMGLFFVNTALIFFTFSK